MLTLSNISQFEDWKKSSKALPFDKGTLVLSGAVALLADKKSIQA